MITLHSLKSRVLGFAALGVIGIAAALPFALSEDGPWVSVGFEQRSYAVAEGDSVTVTVKLDVVPDREVVVPITTAEEGGLGGSDYSGVPDSLTFASWETEKTFSFTAAQDTIDDDGESVRLGFGSLPTGVNEGETDETEVFINDDDGVGVTVSATALTVAEGGSATYTVVLASQPTADVTVTLVTTNGSDVSVNTSSLTFTASNWDDEQTVTVSAAQDDDHLDESATIAHAVTSDDGDYDGMQMASVGVSVIDDEDVPVTVTFDQASHAVAEGSGVTVTVTLSADPERRVVIPLTKSERGGITGADYSGVPETLTFESGETEETFTVTAVQDAVDDDDESVTIGFGSLPNAVTAGATSGTTVAITDDDVPSVTVSFESAAYSVDEGGEVEVKITLSADPERQVVIPIISSEQNGASNDDYSGVPVSATFTSGETEKTFTFTAAQDKIDDDGENDGESVKLAFGAPLPSGVSEGTTTETTLTIIDDDGTGITVSPTTLTMAEGLSKSYTVVLASQPTAGVTITIAAPDNSDVTVDKRALTFTTSNWETAQTVTVSVAHDFDGTDETATITHAVTAAANDYSGKAVASVTVNVLDNDDVRVKANFERESYRVTEGSTATIKVTLDKDPERQVVIPIETVEQNGMTSDDYSGVPSSVTFESGETEKAFAFVAVQDRADDDEESVKLDFGTLPAAVIGGKTGEATVTIVDDDPTFVARDEGAPTDPDVPVKVSFEQASYAVAEGNAVVVRLTLNTDPQRQVVVPISQTEEGGITSADYSGVPSSVTFESGETSSSFTFTAAQDILDDDDESLRLDLGDPPNAVSAGAIKATTISVNDDDGPEAIREVTVSFEQATYAVEEGSGVSVKVMLDGDPGRQVVIPITQTRYGGISPSDYSGIPTQVVFESGEQEKTFDFSATEDMLDDDEEAVALGFGSTLPEAVNMGATGKTMVNIRDNDGVGVRVSPSSLTVDEGEEDTYTVRLNSQPTADVVVTVGTPTDPDVSVDETTLTFTDSTWDDPQTITVSTEQDADYLDDTATISHTVTSTDADYNGVRVRSLSVKVVDDEEVPVEVNFKSASYSVNEGASVRVTVTLDKDPEREVVIPITKTEQGDASTQDYSGVPENVTFRSGQTERTLTFSAYQDNLDDDGESVILGFGSNLPDEVTAGTTNEATVSINDDDGASVIVSSTTLTISEGNSQNYTVVLNSQPTADVTITISTSGSSDVSTDETTLTFTDSDWDDRQTVRVTAGEDDDHLDESATIAHAATSTDSGYNGIGVGSVEVDVTDDEDVPVTVSFGQAAYFVDEGDEVTVEVSLSEDPERRVVIPINKVEQDGATSSDYSGVPRNVIFENGETEQTITFTARQDTVDDDDESVKLGFGTLPNAVTEGTNSEATIDINDDDNPLVKVNFGQAAYAVAEGSTVEVTVTLSADPERQVKIPITKSDQGGVDGTDYSGVPETLTFASGDTEKTFTFTAAQDTLNDDGESVRLSFGSNLPSRISGGTVARTTVSINDDDNPFVKVNFGQAAYSVDEGSTVTVTVTLSADPERRVKIPITKSNQGGVDGTDDYSGVPATLTFASGDTEETFTFTAAQGTLNDDGQSVTLSFGSNLPSRISGGTVARTTVSIKGSAGVLAALVSNTGQSRNSELQFGGDNAQAFTTGSNALGYTLTGVGMLMRDDRGLAISYWVSIHEDAAGVPGSSLGTLMSPNVPVGNNLSLVQHTAFGDGIGLDANSKYWVVIDAHLDDTSMRISATNSDAEDVGGHADWSIANDRRHRNFDATQWGSNTRTKAVQIAIYASNEKPPRAPAYLRQRTSEPVTDEENVEISAYSADRDTLYGYFVSECTRLRSASSLRDYSYFDADGRRLSAENGWNWVEVRNSHGEVTSTRPESLTECADRKMYHRRSSCNNQDWRNRQDPSALEQWCPTHRNW